MSKLFYRVVHSSNGNYKFLTIVLYNELHYMNNIGSINFQSNSDIENYYGKKYQIETDKSNHIVTMGKVAQKINENTNYYAQPSEIISLLGATELYMFEGNLVLESDKGKYLYKVFQNNEHYTNLVSVNDITVDKDLKKLKLEGATIGQKRLIE